MLPENIKYILNYNNIQFSRYNKFNNYVVLVNNNYCEYFTYLQLDIAKYTDLYNKNLLQRLIIVFHDGVRTL